ncbi:MAG: hypothetical protein AB1637_06950 [Elusimicrobiota bacterium]
MNKDFSLLKGKTVVISGFGKNCGKTSFLNYLLSKIKGERGLLSAGTDGEDFDSLSGESKPKIKVFPGDIFICDSRFSIPSVAPKILDTFENGRLVMIKAQREGFIKTAGPYGNHKFGDMIKSLLENGAQTVLIDGALDRITQAAETNNCELFYVARPSPQSLKETVSKLKLLSALSEAPCLDKNKYFFKEERNEPEIIGGTLFFPKALTSQKAEKIPKEAKKIVLEDLTKVFLDLSQWERFSLSKEIFFAKKIKLNAFIVNLYNISRKEFEKEAGSKVLAKTLYNPYEYSSFRGT